MRIPIIIMATLVWVLAAHPPVLAGVTVRAEVDRTTVAPGESLELQVTVSGGKGEADLAGLTDFKVVSRGTSTSVQFINGQMSREETGTYLLIPQHQGQLTIPALAVEVDGQTYHSAPITITVTDQPDAGNRSNDYDNEVWATQVVSNATPYEGQQISYTFRFYNRVQINEAKFQPPEFEGFSSKEIKERRSYRKIINGRETMVSEIDYALTPLQAGAQTIEPAVLQISMIRRDRSRRQSPFDDFFKDPFFNRGTVDTRILQTDPLELEIRPLPPLPPNLEFSGLVGHFDLHAQLESTDLRVGDSATLAITVEGRGNIMDAQPPGLQVPPAFKAYADNPQEEINLDRNGFHGKKVFRTALVPLVPGRFELPAVSLTYFDADQQDYRTLTASTPALSVAASREESPPPVSITPDPLQPLKKKVTFTGRDILPPKENLAAIQSRRPLPWTIFLLGLVAPALILAGTVAVQWLRRQDTRPAALMSAKARQALKTAQKGPASEFLTHLHRALTAAILATAGRLGETLTWKEAEALLLAGGCSAEEARKAAELLSAIETCKFGGLPPSAGQRDELLAQTRQTIRKLVP